MTALLSENERVSYLYYRYEPKAEYTLKAVVQIRVISTPALIVGQNSKMDLVNSCII